MALVGGYRVDALRDGTGVRQLSRPVPTGRLQLVVPRLQL